MDSVFRYLEYRKLIADQAKTWKKSHAGWTLQRLAEQAGVQPPYLTNVLKTRAHLSSDQLYAVCKVFGFDEDELGYTLLLLEWERSSHYQRKADLKEKIDLIRKERLKTDSHLRAPKVEVSLEASTRFYINPELQLVHAFLGVKRFAQNLELIAKSLNIEPDRVEGYVKELKELGYIQIGKGGIEKTQKRIHLSKDSPLCSPQQLLMRYRSLQHQHLLAEKEKYNFAVTFTSDDETRERIHREFLRFLSVIEDWVKDAPSESVYQMHFDLFPWSRH